MGISGRRAFRGRREPWPLQHIRNAASVNCGNGAPVTERLPLNWGSAGTLSVISVLRTHSAASPPIRVLGLRMYAPAVVEQSSSSIAAAPAASAPMHAAGNGGPPTRMRFAEARKRSAVWNARTAGRRSLCTATPRGAIAVTTVIFATASGGRRMAGSLTRLPRHIR